MTSNPLPAFITEPGQPDILLGVMGGFLVAVVLLTGVLFFRLHTLPERLAHKSKKIQFEFVAVLGLISLFTQEHLFWIAGLLLAFIDLPDFSTPIARIAGSLEHMAGMTRAPDPSGEEVRDTKPKALVIGLNSPSKKDQSSA